MFPYINFVGMEFPVYGIVSAVGVAVCAVVAIFLCRRVGVELFDFALTALVGGLGVLLGAHLLYAITRIKDIVATISAYEDYPSFIDFLNRIFDLSSGMVFYGGLYGGLIFGFLWIRKKKLPLYPMADIFAVLIPLFHVFGRVGCFFAGCCYGVECEHGISGRVLSSGNIENIKRLPIQLIESGVLLLLFAVLCVLFFKGKAKGSLLCVYLMSYAVVRFVLEFFRGDAIRGHFLYLSTSQWISLLTLIGVSVYLICHRRNFKN